MTARFVLIVLASLGCAILTGCGDGAESTSLGFLDSIVLEQLPPETAVADSGVELQTVTHPGPSAMDPAVAEQLDGLRASLADLVSAPAVTLGELGEAQGILGMHYLAYEFDDAARTALDNARRLMPRDVRWHYYLATLAQKYGDPETASRHYEHVLAIDRGDLPALVHLAEVYRLLDRDDRAEALLSAAVDQDLTCAAAHYGLGQLSASREDYHDAVVQFETALVHAKQPGPIHYALGMAYRGLGQLDLAQRHLAEGSRGQVPLSDPYRFELEKLKRGAVVLYRRGVQLLERGNPKAAIAVFREVEQLDPDHEGVGTSIAAALAASGDTGGAIRAYRKVIERFPDQAEARFNLGLLLRDQGDLEGAAEQFAVAVDVVPADAVARIQLAIALLRLGRDEQALPHFPEVLEAEPRMAGAHLLYGMTLARLDRGPAAIERLETAREFFPDVWQIADALVRVLACGPERDGQRAVVIALGPIEGGEPNPAQVQSMAMALAATGDVGGAMRVQEKVARAARNLTLPERALVDANLASYRGGGACVQLWPQDDPIYYPLP